jgi:hypothetical protein
MDDTLLLNDTDHVSPDALLSYANLSRGRASALRRQLRKILEQHIPGSSEFAREYDRRWRLGGNLGAEISRGLPTGTSPGYALHIRFYGSTQEEVLTVRRLREEIARRYARLVEETSPQPTLFDETIA